MIEFDRPREAASQLPGLRKGIATTLAIASLFTGCSPRDEGAAEKPDTTRIEQRERVDPERLLAPYRSAFQQEYQQATEAFRQDVLATVAPKFQNLLLEAVKDPFVGSVFDRARLSTDTLDFQDVKKAASGLDLNSAIERQRVVAVTQYFMNKANDALAQELKRLDPSYVVDDVSVPVDGDWGRLSKRAAGTFRARLNTLHQKLFDRPTVDRNANPNSGHDTGLSCQSFAYFDSFGLAIFSDTKSDPYRFGILQRTALARADFATEPLRPTKPLADFNTPQEQGLLVMLTHLSPEKSRALLDPQTALPAVRDIVADLGVYEGTSWETQRDEVYGTATMRNLLGKWMNRPE